MKTKYSFSVVALLFLFQNLLAQNSESKLTITHLTGDFYLYTTYNLYKGTRIPANGLYLVTNNGVVLVDSPWDTTQFQPLLDRIKMKHNKNIVMCIATHFHDDRTGGLEYYKKLGIKTYTTKKTDGLSKKRGMKRAEFLIEKDTTFTIGQYSFQTYFPGHGHAPDNIVVWFERKRVLYGGCLIKTVDDVDLGNLGDASQGDYAITVSNVQRKFEKPKFVIPGHGFSMSTKSIQHTFDMARQLKQKNGGQ
ncbi:MAG: BlaB/IND/MUS family subclass B1 metallo-beta-lactamase [Cyclobacteriaceae bacterium]